METFYFPRRNAEAQSGHRRRSGGPVEAPLRRKAETDRVRERISEGFFSAKPERVASGDVGAAEPRLCILLNKFFRLLLLSPQRRPLLLTRASAPC